MQGAGAGFGFTLGSAFATLLNDALTEEQMQSFGWRIPFWFGASAGLAAYFAKDHVEDYGYLCFTRPPSHCNYLAPLPRRPPPWRQRRLRVRGWRLIRQTLLLHR